MNDYPVEPQEPHTRRIVITRPVAAVPRRVVSLVPSLTESLFDLNLGGRLVAVTDYCTRPADRVARLPKVGGTKNPDVQRIIALRPDLVMMNDEENRREDAEALQRANLDVWVAGPRNVQEMFNLLWDIMDVFDDASYSERVRVIEKTLDVVTLAMNAHPPLRTFVPIWRDPWMSFNRDTYVHDVLRVFGLANVFAGRERRFPLEADLGEMEPLPPDSPRVIGRDTRYPRVTLAEVEAQQPELIFLPDEPYSFQEEDAEVFYRLDIPAAHCGNIYLVDGALLTWHGTRLAYTLTELPPIIDEARSRLAGSPDTSEDASA